MSKVAIVRCESYEPLAVQEAVERLFGLLDLPTDLFTPGEAILLKPNLLGAASSDRAVTTHPEVFSAVARKLLASGVTLSYGDSPAVVGMSKAAKASGIAGVASDLGIPEADFVSARTVASPPGSLITRFPIAAGALDVSGIVSISKLKTHGFTVMTGAIKNLFGCIPGLKKAEFHATLPDPKQFGRMLVDLNRTIKPRLHIMDAIVAMEGNGPGSGNPRSLNCILGSIDPAALDSVAARLIDLDPESLDYLMIAESSGLGHIRNVTLVGDPIDAFKVTHFDRPTHSAGSGKMVLIPITRRFILPRPTIRKDNCVRCGQCVRICPVTPKALTMDMIGNYPEYHYERCIRCYCCQEVCPEGAIQIRVPFLGKLLKL